MPFLVGVSERRERRRGASEPPCEDARSASPRRRGSEAPPAKGAERPSEAPPAKGAERPR